jgi:hypothetical protein
MQLISILKNGAACAALVSASLWVAGCAKEPAPTKPATSTEKPADEHAGDHDHEHEGDEEKADKETPAEKPATQEEDSSTSGAGAEVPSPAGPDLKKPE